MKKLINTKLTAVAAVFVLSIHLLAFTNYPAKHTVTSSIVLKNIKLKKMYRKSHVEYFNFSFTYNGSYAESTIYDPASTGSTGTVSGVFYVYLNGTNYYSGYSVTGTYDIGSTPDNLTVTITRDSDSADIVDYNGTCIYGTSPYI
ncbi:MAG: hypothetical protein ACXVAY_02345 [Mucilaginibacter sp.]